VTAPRRTGIQPKTNIDVVDTHSLFSVVSWARRARVSSAPERQITFNYRALIDVLREVRRESGLDEADAHFAGVNIDPEKVDQAKYVQALEHLGYTVERINYRHVYVEPPTTPATLRGKGSMLQSMAPYFAFMLGLKTGQAYEAELEPQFVVVSGAFEIYPGLKHVVELTKARPVIAYFRQFLDRRWATVGLFEPNPSIEFVDLTRWSVDLIGVDLAQSLTAQADADRGLASLL